MHKHYSLIKLAVFAVLVFLGTGLLLTGYFLIRNSLEPDVLGSKFCKGISPCVDDTEPPVTVRAFIRIREIYFEVHPEKRIPATGNWGTTVDVTLENCSNSSIRNFNDINTNDPLGRGRLPISVSNPLPDGNYRFYVRGKSHLMEEFNCYTLDTISPEIDLYLENKDLLAGEVSVIYDNYINSLDLSILIKEMFTASDLSDLNQDSEVNSLDLGNQIYNIFKAGD